MTYTSGQVLQSAELNSWLPITAVKPSGTSRTSNISRTADPDLTVPVLANYTYEGELVISYTGAAAGDIALEMAYPTGASCSVVQVGPHNAIATTGSQASDVEFQAQMLDGTSPTGAMPFGATGGTIGALVLIRLVMSSTAGTLVVNWAQLASSGTATTLNAGSWLTIRRVA